MSEKSSARTPSGDRSVRSRKEFFHSVKQLYLPVLTQYHPEDGDEPTYPWISNWHLGLQSGKYDDLIEAKSADLYPDELFAHSELPSRQGGYALWDFILRNGRTVARTALDQTDARPIADGKCAFPKTPNKWWFDVVANAYMQKAMKPLPYHRDFIEGDGYLLDAAHALTHLYGDERLPALSFWKSYTYLSGIFSQYLVELYIADEFGIPIDIYKPPGQTLALGVVGHPTLRYGFSFNWPTLQAPYSYDLLPDKDFAHVSAALEIGSDPIDILLPGSAPTEADRLAYQPRRLICTGWALSSWLYCQDIRRSEYFGWGEKPRAAFTALCSDLFSPHWFHYYLDEAREAGIGMTSSRRPLDEWKDELKNMISMSPTLPCTNCLLFNHHLEDGIRLAPARWKSRHADKMKLKNYRKRLRKSLRHVLKAQTKVYGKEYRSLRSAQNKRHKELQRRRRGNSCRTRKRNSGY